MAIDSRDIAEYLGRRGLGVPDDREVIVSRMPDSDRWMIADTVTGSRFFVDGIVVHEIASSGQLETIYEEVKAEFQARERGFQVFPGWRAANNFTVTPPEYRAARRK